MNRWQEVELAANAEVDGLNGLEGFDRTDMINMFGYGVTWADAHPKVQVIAQASANGQKKHQQGKDFMKSKAIAAFKENCPCWSRFRQDRKCDECTWLKEFCNKLDE